MANSPKHQVFGPQNRRNFLKSVAGVSLAAILAGCGSEGGPNIFADPGNANPTRESAAATGRVLLSEVGGQNHSVISFGQAAAAVDPSGGFSTGVSSQGGQLLFLMDGENKLRALGISIPDPQVQPRASEVRPRVDLLEISAESTALSLVLLVRGILTINPLELTERISQLRALVSFSALRQAVLQDLQNESLDLLAPRLQALIEAVAREWLAGRSPKSEVAPRIEPIAPVPGNGNVGLELLNQDGPLNGLQVQFTNNAWRFVSLIGQDLGTGDVEVPPLRLPVVEGVANPSNNRNILPAANGASWGGLFTGQNLNPATGFERVPLQDRTTVKRLKYFAYGPGSGINLNGVSNATLPPGVTPDMIHPDPFGLTIFYFGFLPILDFIGGAQSTAEGAFAQVFGFWKEISGHGVSLDNVRQSFESGNGGNISLAIGDLFAAVMLLGAGIVAGGFTGTAAAAMEVLLGLGAAVAIFFSAVNWVAATLSWLALPLISEVSIDAPPRNSYVVKYLYHPEVDGPLTGIFDFADVAVNATGQLLVRRKAYDPDGLIFSDPVISFRDTAGNLTDIEGDPHGNLDGISETPRSRSVLINRNGDLAWRMGTDSPSPTNLFPSQVRFKHKDGSSLTLPFAGLGDRRIYSLLDRRPDGKVHLFGQNYLSSDSHRLFMYTPGTGTFDLSFFELLGRNSADLAISFATINNNGLMLGAAHNPDLSEVFAFLYQHPLTDGTPASAEVVDTIRNDYPNVNDRRLYNWLALNDRGDYAFSRPKDDLSGYFLVIRRVGKPEIQMDLPDRLRVARMNEAGDLFIHYQSRLLKLPASGGEPVDLTPFLPVTGPLNGMDAQGPYVAVSMGQYFVLLEEA